MSTKRGPLAGLISQKPNTPVAPEPVATKPAEEVTRGDGRAGYTLRVDPAVLKQLKQMAIDEDTNVRLLFVEALNDLFRKWNRPTIAE
jgi:hypothetical protein